MGWFRLQMYIFTRKFVVVQTPAKTSFQFPIFTALLALRGDIFLQIYYNLISCITLLRYLAVKAVHTSS